MKALILLMLITNTAAANDKAQSNTFIMDDDVKSIAAVCFDRGLDIALHINSDNNKVTIMCDTEKTIKQLTEECKK